MDKEDRTEELMMVCIHLLIFTVALGLVLAKFESPLLGVAGILFLNINLEYVARNMAELKYEGGWKRRSCYLWLVITALALEFALVAVLRTKFFPGSEIIDFILAMGVFLVHAGISIFFAKEFKDN